MVTITKENITLRDLKPEDKEQLVWLANNPNISSRLRDAFPNPYTIKDAEDFLNKQKNTNASKVFAIEYNGIFVGNIALTKGIDVYRKSAELGYFLGEPFWNKGIMTKAVNIACDYGFKRMDIVRIYAGVFEYNAASIRVLEKCGFKREAVLEKAVYKNQKYFNEIRYAKILD
jgi:RimJ/RimL family protein N-acetyltransferase